MKRPTRVTRGSSSLAQPRAAGLGIGAHRAQLEQRRTAGRRGRRAAGGRKPGPRLSSFTSSANSAISGKVSASSRPLAAMSNRRLADARERAARREAVGEDQPAGIERVEIDPPGLALDEAGEVVDVDPGGLDPQQVLERQRVAPFLEREHDLAGAEIGDEARQVVDRARAGSPARPRGWPSFMPTIADDGEAALGRARPALEPRRARRRRRAPAPGAGTRSRRGCRRRAGGWPSAARSTGPSRRTGSSARTCCRAAGNRGRRGAMIARLTATSSRAPAKRSERSASLP